MGTLFAIIILLTFGLVFNSVQANTITLAFSELFGANRLLPAIILSVLTLLTIFGGIHRVARVSGILVPIMAVAYILVALFILVTHIPAIPALIGHIFANAFGWEQFVGGGLGATIMQGIRRGLFSNEAGMGSAPNAAATATVSHPVKQGLIQALSVFTDTVIICSCTAFIILLSGIPIDGSMKGIQLTQAALDNELGSFGSYFVAFSILLFAFSSIVGNYSYCEPVLYFPPSALSPDLSFGRWSDGVLRRYCGFRPGMEFSRPVYGDHDHYQPYSHCFAGTYRPESAGRLQSAKTGRHQKPRL